jgi:hypothetical protein
MQVLTQPVNEVLSQNAEISHRYMKAGSMLKIEGRDIFVVTSKSATNYDDASVFIF